MNLSFWWILTKKIEVYNRLWTPGVGNDVWETTLTLHVYVFCNKFQEKDEDVDDVDKQQQ